MFIFLIPQSVCPSLFCNNIPVFDNNDWTNMVPQILDVSVQEFDFLTLLECLFNGYIS